MAKEAFEALRSSCKLKTDFDKLQAIENGSKEDLRLLPITLSLITINFCCVLTRSKKKKTTQLLYWRWKVQPVLIHFICDTECKRCSEHRGTVATYFAHEQNTLYQLLPKKDNEKVYFPHFSLWKQSLQIPLVMED